MTTEEEILPDGSTATKQIIESVSTVAEMYTCDVLYRKGQILCQGHGSTKRQAERNAGIMGLRWLDDHLDFQKKEIK